MDFNSDEDHKNKPKCTTCGNYLSYFPVFSSSNNINVCGRCPTPPQETHLRNEVYEILSEFVPFPCRYHKEGCYEVLTPVFVPQHENQCPFKPSICPTRTTTKCSVKVCDLSVLKHCEDKHPDLFLQNEEFEVDVSQSHQSINLFKHNGRLLILKKKYDQKNHNLQFSITRKETEGFIFRNVPFEVVFTFGTRSLTVKSVLRKESDKNRNATNIRLDSLITRQQKPPKITAKILIGVKPNFSAQTINNELVKLLTCSKCLEYTLPPVLNFSEGVCQKCFNKGYRGSKVTPQIDALANLLQYSCKNATIGCTFTSQHQHIKNHHKLCEFNVEVCPMLDSSMCKWHGPKKDFGDHVTTDHQVLFLNSCMVSEDCSYPHYFSNCYILRFSRYVFKLNFWKGRDYFWCMQMIGEFRNEFVYEIEMVDSQGVQKMLVCGTCSPFCKDFQSMTNLQNCFRCSRDQIRGFLDDEQNLTFKVRVFKN